MPPLDPESLALSQHAWLQFEEHSATFMRCRRILRMSVPTPRSIDWGLLADAGEAAAVREADDEELPPDIEFSLCGQHFEMSIERFAMLLGIYYEPETVRDDFAQAPTQGEEGVMRAWWSQIDNSCVNLLKSCYSRGNSSFSTKHKLFCQSHHPLRHDHDNSKSRRKGVHCG
ncbi:hypothetical protein E3N88_21642 [Mikania micrantha]|uniref:Uncharacterized protein n=1 Tax=Mikania micrantha TaxID=192012 RepID=A0A5N6N865_9ASTR|nr:hypothetical protein E3N88_21642 [Mikania micrantha]